MNNQKEKLKKTVNDICTVYSENLFDDLPKKDCLKINRLYSKFLKQLDSLKGAE